MVVSLSPFVELKPIARTFARSGSSSRTRAPLVNPVCSPRLSSWLKSVKSTEVSSSGRPESAVL